jgi:hypothetical protein
MKYNPQKSNAISKKGGISSKASLRKPNHRYVGYRTMEDADMRETGGD